MLQAALSYTAQGFKVFPLKPGGKVPITAHGVKDATQLQASVRDYWRKHPDANIGLSCDGLLVLDFDGKAGTDSKNELIAKYGELPQTWVIKTGGGTSEEPKEQGEHWVYRVPTDLNIRPGAGKYGYQKLDIRANDSYIVASPSVTRLPYETIDSSPVADAPEWLIELAKGRNNGAKPKRTAKKAVTEHIPQGERNARLTSIAGAMRRQGTTPEAILAALLEVNISQCEPPLPENDVRRIAESVGRYEPAETTSGEYNRSDSGMGERLADIYHGKIRFVHLWGQWLIYRGGCWYPDNIGEVKLLAKLAVRSMYAGAAEIESKEERRKYLDYVLAAESERRINAALTMAASEKGIATDATELDAQPWLLNVRNGTINLNTCTLRPHNPADLLTQIADVDFIPAATSDEWDTFLLTIFKNDTELIDYIRRAVGYTLNGTQTERAFFFCHGLGRNGKSQFLAALRYVLGPYAAEAKPDTFMEQKFKVSGPDEGLAALRGIRLLTATEVKKGHEINTGLIKRMTGGEPLWHERKFQHGYSFQPTHTLWLSGNHEPRITDTTDSIWDRLKKIPFNVRIAESQDIKAYGEKLAKAHGPAILAWMIKGAREWNQGGLSNEPDVVKTAISEYRAHQDALHDFEKERIKKTPGNSATIADIYNAFCKWCTDNDQETMTKRAFNEAMRERGYRDQRGTGNKAVWVGVTLVTEVTDFTESSTTARAREETFGKNGNESNLSNYSELPDCPNCGVNEWSYGADGLECPCGYKMEAGQGAGAK